MNDADDEKQKKISTAGAISVDRVYTFSVNINYCIAKNLSF